MIFYGIRISHNTELKKTGGVRHVTATSQSETERYATVSATLTPLLKEVEVFSK
jgi:hypothetical protein